MDTKKAQELLARQRSGTITPKEKAMLESWYNELSASTPSADLPGDLERKQQQDFAHIEAATRPRVRLMWVRVAAAGCVIFAIGVFSYLLFRPKPQVPQTAQLIQHDIAPGHNQATLTLANGQKIILTKGLSGQLATQNQTIISAAQNTVTYQANSKSDQLIYNTLSTAKGEQSPYPLVLADGTKVWLNAESSITFPTSFNQKERIVKLTGEAYFEVKHNAAHPFKVQTATQTIEDIGTQFNVKAYDDEPAAATLVQGSVKVNGEILKPGEELLGDHMETANLKEVLAWKDGYFRFNDAPITTIMRELARWYDIEVVYEGTVTQEHFTAKISRYKNISNVLRMLEKTNHVRFKIEGRRVTVLSKS